ncbi:hypothetical protein HDU81_006369 [Chytriomyces hyalinus]|nr:hypothetical protein HDU81_006369 [Chytriomyces hyalinus]
MAQRDFDVMVLAATGFTGMYVARDLQNLVREEPIKWAMAGRSSSELQETLAWMGPGKTPPSELVVADASDSQSLQIPGYEVVAACIEAGTHYVDISGEPVFVERILTLFDKAEERGFEKRGYTATSVEMFIRLTSGPLGISGNFATYESAVQGLSHAHELRALRKKANRAQLPIFGKKTRIQENPRFEKRVSRWCIPFFGADASVWDSKPRNLNTKVPVPTQFSAYFCTDSIIGIAGLMFFGLSMSLLTRFAWGKKLLLAYPKVFSLGTFSKAGPTEAQMAASGFISTFYVKGFKKHLSIEDSGNSAVLDYGMTVVVKGPEPGYVATPISVILCALAIRNDERKNSGNVPRGVLSPAAAFAQTPLIRHTRTLSHTHTLSRMLPLLRNPHLRTAMLPRPAATRPYHYTSNQVYGYREPVARSLPDYTEEQLSNRAQASNLLRFVTYYRSLGHRLAALDPLSLTPADPSALYQLDPKRYGLSEGQTFDVDGILNTGSSGPQRMGLEEIVARLNKTYAGSVGFEFAHLPNVAERRWCNELVEKTMAAERGTDTDAKKRMMYLLSRSEVFDHFMAKRFPQVKRYGLEGAESMMIVMDELFKASSGANVRDVVIGMPHRGRLNLLTDLLKYNPASLFNKIKGNSEFPEDVPGAGDVLSHVAQSVDLEYPGAESPVHVSLLHNPSHLEAINPVAAGKARAKQFDLLEKMTQSSTSSPECDIGDRVLCVQLHGDSAFAGQGVVMETLALSNLPHYTCGGSIHVIVNNQIGYTTQSFNARSTIYSSDVGKIIDAPVIHVNADFPEDVAIATKIAFEYRNKFRKDVIIDLIAYRRMGHNELDEPAFTQPVMYKHIRGRRSVPKLFEQKLIEEGVVSQQEIEKIREEYSAHLDQQLESSYTYKPEADTLKGKWSEMVISKADVTKIDTGVSLETLKQVGVASVASHGVTPHSRLAKFHITPRLNKIESGTGLDWATCEALAFGSLLLENKHVRISGQDVGRGTFSQRHAMLVDQSDEHTVIPLNHITPTQPGKLEIANSNLSEFAVLGFEVGVSWENPNRLCIWEAQFGDFFNGAQIIIDTFVSSSESKWLRQTGLVMLLPHGYDGAGPEHSSCKIERFLQLTDSKFEYDDPTPDNCNMHVAYPTTPAQMFHLLRRQMVRNYRRPLIIAGPKTLLRHPSVVSNLSEMGPGTSFQPVLSDGPSDSAKRVVFLSGKLYYDLVKEREAKGLVDSVAFVRLEEIAPFPWEEVKSTLAGFPNAEEFVWVQEEPQNQGAYTFVAPRLAQVLPEGAKLRYAGRKTLAVPATGISARYKAEQAAVIAGAFA